MRILLTGGQVFTNGSFQAADIALTHGRIVSIASHIPEADFDRVLNCHSFYIVPGFVDVHVHLREPGFSYKETISTGTMAAARGGYTTVCAMPNLTPAPDTLPHLTEQLDLIRAQAQIEVLPYGCITMGQQGSDLADLAALAPYVAGFSDDGRGVQQRERMRAAMEQARALQKPIVAHCEDNSLLRGGYIHDGAYAAAHGHKGICSESEWGQIARDLALVEQTGCRYHVCHISTKESVALIHQAQAKGLPVTCETAPHYLLLCDEQLQEEGRFKMNPPIRSAADRDALIEGLRDGTISCIATDHAPHSAEEKSRGLAGSLMGIVGLETAFSVLHTGLVQTGALTLERLVEALCVGPRQLLERPWELQEGAWGDLAVLDLHRPRRVDSSEFYSMGRATPFEGMDCMGDVVLTLRQGELVWDGRTTGRTT